MYLFLGGLMDVLGLLVFTIPIFFPIVVSLGFDPIWFGVVVTVMIEIGLITPPVGINCMIIRNIASNKLSSGVTSADVFVGIGWFVFMDLITVMILIIFPQTVLFLPNFMYQ
jgi:TRAP-type C4-dicarboxylate transport system permease large subunit